jgi:hypothetical protein
MGERFVLALLSLVVGLLIGLLAPGVIPGASDIAPAERAWLNPTRPTPESTVGVVVTLPKVAAAQTAVPPTLTPPQAPGRPPEPTPEPGAAPEPTSTTRTFIIPLAGGGEMKVVANDEAAARNNVKSAGAVPAN